MSTKNQTCSTRGACSTQTACSENDPVQVRAHSENDPVQVRACSENDPVQGRAPRAAAAHGGAPDYEAFARAARAAFATHPADIITDYLRCFAYGTEASCYRYVPRVVAIARSEADVAALFALARRYGTPLCFRAAGSSLSGQSACESVLVLMKFAFEQIAASADAIELGAGVLGQAANDYLAPLGRKIGPDPATIATALIGGILSNNSSGMCCGTADNSYKTLQSIRVMLPDGALLDTADPASVAAFRKSHAALLAELSAMREQILADAELAALIRRKFAIKNTTGYSLNAFVDFADPVDILAHLFIGAEGTLGAIFSARLRTLATPAHTACALLFYERISDAAAAISAFAAGGYLASAEIMDYACLKIASQTPELAELLASVAPGSTAVLVQAEAASKEELERKIARIREDAAITSAGEKHAPSESAKPGENPASVDLRLSTDAAEYALWWKIRKALLPLAASTRRAGSTVITEDLCFRPSELADGIARTQELFAEFGFANNGIIFGHALAGNIHFIITPLLSDAREAANFAALVEKMARVVALREGSIKAEHGTGRMVAPFVELEWGAAAAALNRRIKALIDPLGLCNPDVIITDDAQLYKKRIKSAPAVDERLDKCMECGMCERFCPSASASLSPRQRIAVLREIKRLEAASAGDFSLLGGENLSAAEARRRLKQLRGGYKYFVEQTCAACSMCALGCPLGIDVAAFTSDYRRAHEGAIARAAAGFLQRHHAGALGAARWALGAANRFAAAAGYEKLDRLAQALSKRSFSTLPQARAAGAADGAAGERATSIAQNAATGAATATTEATAAGQKQQNTPREVVYFGSCLNAVFAPNPRMHDPRPLAAVAASLAQKAGIRLLSRPAHLCCSKAYDANPAAAAAAQEQLRSFLATQRADVVFDHSACAAKAFAAIGREFVGADGQSHKILDLIEFCEQILPELKITPLAEDVAIYLMCAARKSGLGEALRRVAAACTSGAVVEDAATFCCGFAGYKGFVTPALNAGAVGKFKRFYAQRAALRGFCSSSTCEIGLADATQSSWQHIAYLLDEASARK